MRSVYAALISGQEVLPLSDVGTIAWSLRPGVEPYITEISVLSRRAERWLEAVGRGGFESVSTGWSAVSSGGIKLHLDGREFHDLRLLSASQYDAHHVTLRVADWRSDWQFVRLYMRANVVRRGNDRYRVAEVVNPTDAGIPDDIRTFGSYRYAQWSLQIDPFAPISQPGVPWTAKALAVEILRRMFAKFGRTFDDSHALAIGDNGVPIDQQQFVGMTAPQALAYCLARANLDIRITQDGAIELYDPYLPLHLPDGAVIGGAMRVSRMARVRPREIRWRVPIVREVRVYALARTVESATLGVPSLDPWCQNVGQLTYELPIYERSGVSSVLVGKHQPGTWVPLSELMQYFNVDDATIRAHHQYPEVLYQRYCLAAGAALTSASIYDTVRLAHMQTLIKAYRTTWRINPLFADRQLSIRGTRVDVLDPTDRTAAPSPVYTDWFETRLDLPMQAGVVNRPSVGEMAKNYSSFDSNPITPAPFSLVMLDEERGIFMIDPFPPLDPMITARVPSHVTTPPAVTAFDLQNTLAPLTSFRMSLAERFALETIVTVEPAAPNHESPSTYWEYVYKASGDEAGGHVAFVEEHYNGEPARVNVDGELVNRRLLETILIAESKAVYEALADKPRGVLTLAHDAAVPLVVHSHIRSITVSIEAGRVAVTIDAGEPRPKRYTMAMLPPTVAAYLQRQIVAGFREGGLL